jgi:VWFA-related protein
MKLLSVIAFLGVAPCLGQNAPTSPPADQPVTPLHMQSSVVLVPALVRNAKGEIIFTLQQSDFRLTDDGIPQTLTLDEDTDNEPLALVVAVESGGSAAARLDQYRNLGAVIDAVIGGVEHHAALVQFDSEPRLIQDFTPDLDRVAEALNGLRPGDKGAAILDALQYSVDLLSKQPPTYRRAILLISETLDRGSHAQIGDALRSVSDTNTAIFSLGFSTNKAQTKRDAGKIWVDHTPGPAHGCMAKDPNAEDVSGNRWEQAFDCLGLLVPPLRLAKLAAMSTVNGFETNVPETVARLTGGEYFRFENANGLVRDLVTISNHVPNRYVLSFQPHAPQVGFHSIELKVVNNPSLQVAARSGYWVDAVVAPNAKP